MKKNGLFTKIIMVLLLAAFILSGCSKKLQTGTESSDILNYSFSDVPVHNYESNSKINQLIIIGGQEVAADIESQVSFSLTRIGEMDKKIDLKVMVDSIYSVVKSMQGDMISNPEEVKGKEFSMKLSVKGEESGLEEAADIKYASLGGEMTDLKTSFSFIFPDLPTGATGVGYTWVDNDTIDLSTGSQTVLMIQNSNNTIVAKEKYNGYDCYKISYTSTGERNSSGDTAQGFMTSSGNMTGTGYIYFAPKEGKVIHDHTTQKFEGELTVPTGDSFPMYMDITIDTELKK